MRGRTYAIDDGLKTTIPSNTIANKKNSLSDISIFILWPEAESNCRPLVFQTSALPTELSGRFGGDDGIRTRDLLRDRQA